MQIVFCLADHLLFLSAIKLVRLQSEHLFEAVKQTRHIAWFVHCILRVLASYLKRSMTQKQLTALVLTS